MSTNNENKKENTKEINTDNTKTCFIITPIGDDNTAIRRHIDGVIDGVIFPILDEKGYTMEVSHRISTPGSINKQVISKIYSSDLVISNLTGLNANVMYELSFRHATRKPVIMIMEKGEKSLPFDVNNERTIFYTNDFQGAIDLKNDLLKVINGIEKNYNDVDNPIYTALENMNEKETVIKIINKDTGEKADALKYIVNKLEVIEQKVNKNILPHNLHNQLNIARNQCIVDVKLEKCVNWNTKQRDEFFATLCNKSNMNQGIDIHEISWNKDFRGFRLVCNLLNDMINAQKYFDELIKITLEELDIHENYSLSVKFMSMS